MKEINIAGFSKYYHYNFSEGYVFSGHTHAEWEINIVLSGQMSVTYGGSVLTLSKGDFFVGEPWGFHCNRLLGSDAEMVVIHFSALEESFSQGFAAKSLTDDEFALVRICIREFESFCGGDGDIGATESGAYFNATRLCEVLVSKAYATSEKVTKDNTSGARLYRSAVKYMEDNISEKLSIGSLSAELHVSAALLKRVFSRFAGAGVMEYFSILKISRAKKLLEDGNPISYISDTLGFSSQCYFTSVFGKIVGETPKNYQKRHSVHK